MTLRDTLALAFRNLRQSRLRTALTTLGVAIGIASLAGMVSLGVGLQDQVVGRLTQSGVFDSITVTGGGGALAMLGGRGGPMPGRGGRGGRSGGSPALPLDDDALARFAQLPHVRDAYPNLRIAVRITLDEVELASTAAGVPASSRNEGAYQDMAHGAFFPDGATDVCLLSLSMAAQLSSEDPASLVGRTLTISWAASGPGPGGAPGNAGGVAQAFAQRVDRAFTITGIVERDPTAGAPAGFAGVMIPLAQAREIHASLAGGPQSVFQPAGGTRSYASITVRVSGAQHTQDVQDAIKAMGFTAFSLNDALQGAKRAFLLLDILLGLVGSIALAVSSLGIVNTMVMSILERTREIGIMKAIGGGDGDIRRIFLVEASVIGLLGGASGLVLGWGFGRIINFGANVYIESQGGTAGNLFSLPWWLILGSLAFALLVSLAAGAYPARRAARLDPIQALRHE